MIEAHLRTLRDCLRARRAHNGGTPEVGGGGVWRWAAAGVAFYVFITANAIPDTGSASLCVFFYILMVRDTSSPKWNQTERGSLVLSPRWFYLTGTSEIHIVLCNHTCCMFFSFSQWQKTKNRVALVLRHLL